ncbi:MAG TPA: HdeD family acid-resistance protein [Rubrobacter sp.]|nr:HdeD family acid-resistance protein [Rubrobacter sp.]
MSSEGRFRQRFSTLAANWRVLALRGLAALIFGLVILFWPGLILAVLSLLFGVYALVDGAIVVVPALRTSDRGARRWLPLAEGTVGIVAGLVALLWPAMTPRGLLYVIVVWAVATGTLKIFTAIALRGAVENGWLLVGSGALSVLLGVVLATLAGSDLPAMAPFIGIFAIVVGVALIVFAFRTRDRQRNVEPRP